MEEHRLSQMGDEPTVADLVVEEIGNFVKSNELVKESKIE